MNDDLISRQKAIELEAEKALEMLPSTQLEWKKGRRISLCDEHSDYEENFCPNCGADTERWTGWEI